MSSSFNQNLYQISTRALRQLGAIAQGETPTADMLTDCATAMNAMTKEWEASGLHLWTETQGILFLQPNQNTYLLGPSSSDHAALAPATMASLALNANAGANSITITAPASVAAGDNVGVVLGSGSVFWTTAAATSSAATITLTAALPSSAQAGGAVFSYPVANACPRPLRVLELRRRYLPSGQDTPLGGLARLDFFALPNKNQPGIVNQWFYDPQLTNGVMRVWQPPMAPIQWSLHFTFMRQINDWSSPANVGDFPQEWVNPLTYNLAVEMAPEFDIDPRRLQFLMAQAEAKKQVLMDWDREPESVYFGVSFDPGYR